MNTVAPHSDDSEKDPLAQLQSVVDTLIGPDGCPWDKEQTPQSLADYVLEESHELMDAMHVCPWDNAPKLEDITKALADKSQQVVSAIRFGTEKDMYKDVCEELGDVAFLLLFIAKLYEKQGAFSLNTALQMGAQKMIRRHPHVFGETKFENLDAQLKEWERIKRQEKGADSQENEKPAGIFDSLPTTLPPLIKAYRIHSKSARVNFTWPEEQDVEQQMEAEWLEWLDVAQGEDKDAQMHELGDMLFTLVELGRRKGIKASEALDHATARFLNRFACMETFAHERGLNFAELSLDDKDDLWNEVKEAQKKAKT